MLSEWARCGVRAGGCAGAARSPPATAGLGAGRSAGAGFGAGAAAAGFSFSSPARTGEGRDSSPRRCALPITALRLTPPSSSAIWLAVEPSAHIALRRSIRSSVQLMKIYTPYVLRVARRADRRLSRERPDSIMDTRRTRQGDAQRRQLGRAQDPLYQGGEALLQGADANRVGAGDYHLALSGHLY